MTIVTCADGADPARLNEYKCIMGIRANCLPGESPMDHLYDAEQLVSKEAECVDHGISVIERGIYVCMLKLQDT